MRYSRISLWGLLWVWLPLFHSQAADIDKAKTDFKSLAQTTISRIEALEFRPVPMKVDGLDFLPEQLPAETLQSIDDTLRIFHQVLTSLSQVPVTQIIHDVEDLRKLIQSLGSTSGCEFSPSAPGENPESLKEPLTTSPYTTAVVTLDRLKKCLGAAMKFLDQFQGC